MDEYPYPNCVSVIKSQCMKKMYNTGEKLRNILSYVDFSKLCNAIKYFSELNRNFLKEGINFPL